MSKLNILTGEHHSITLLYELPTQITYGDGIVFLYTRNNSTVSKGNITLLNGTDFSLIGFIDIQYYRLVWEGGNVGRHYRVFYDSATKYVGRVIKRMYNASGILASNSTVNIYSAVTLQSLYNVSMDALVLIDSLICHGYLVLVTEYETYFLE